MSDSVNNIEPGSYLLSSLELLGDIVWSRYRNKFNKIYVGSSFELISNENLPPYVSFRFKIDNYVLNLRLKDVVESYRGILEWTIHEHKRIGLDGVNRIISPKKDQERWNDFGGNMVMMDEYYRANPGIFSSSAYDDMLGLANHIRKEFQVL